MRRLSMWVLAGMMMMTVGTAVGAEASPKRVVFFVNEGFHPKEYKDPRAVFDREGFSVTVAGPFRGLVPPGRRYRAEYSGVNAELVYDEVRVTDYDAVVFAGGGGAWSDYFPNPVVHQVLTVALQREGMIVGLVCAATGLLATANNLDGKGKPLAEGRKVTGYFQVEGLLKTMGRVSYDPGEKGKPKVVKDGRLITGRDPESAELFGRTIAEALSN